MRFRSLNPHDPADMVGEWDSADASDVADVSGRAKLAAAVWGTTPAIARGAALASAASAMELHAEELTALIVREVGKPVSEAKAEIARAVAIFRYYAQIALLPDGETLPAATDTASLLISRRRPIGVAALITPWNFPVAIPLWKAAPSLAYGNATILKPASQAAATAIRVHEIVSAHFPPDVFQVVLGGAEVAEPLCDHPDVAAVSFTGSVPVGMSVARRVAGRGARVQAEMGGQNASVVLGDADLDRAASTIAYASMAYAGQKCTATGRVIVEESAYDDFRDRLVATIESLGVVDPTDPHTIVGPVIDVGSRDAAIEAVGASGGRVLTGGKALQVPGSYLAPTLVELDAPVGVLAKEEVFAPVAALIRADDAGRAIAIANDVRFGLVAAVFTRDLERALHAANDLDVGMIRINAPTSGVDFHAPFGGAKDSSLGPREQGLAAREFYTESRTILVMP